MNIVNTIDKLIEKGLKDAFENLKRMITGLFSGNENNGDYRMVNNIFNILLLISLSIMFTSLALTIFSFSRWGFTTFTVTSIFTCFIYILRFKETKEIIAKDIRKTSLQESIDNLLIKRYRIQNEVKEAEKLNKLSNHFEDETDKGIKCMYAEKFKRLKHTYNGVQELIDLKEKEKEEMDAQIEQKRVELEAIKNDLDAEVEELERVKNEIDQIRVE